MELSSNSYVIEQSKQFATSGSANVVETAGEFLVPTLERTSKVKRIALLVESSTLADIIGTNIVLNFNSVDAISTPLAAHAPILTGQEQIYYDVDVLCGSKVIVKFENTKAVAVKTQARFIYE